VFFSGKGENQHFGRADKINCEKHFVLMIIGQKLSVKKKFVWG